MQVRETLVAEMARYAQESSWYADNGIVERYQCYVADDKGSAERC